MQRQELPQCDGPAATAPLVALLDRARAGFVAEFERRMATTEFGALSFAQSRDVLRHLGDGPLRAAQIAGRCEVTKQAISLQIAQLQRNGYLDVSRDPVDGRARLLTLTESGRRAQRAVARVFDEIESDWQTRLGDDGWRRLREALAEFADRHAIGP